MRRTRFPRYTTALRDRDCLTIPVSGSRQRTSRSLRSAAIWNMIAFHEFVDTLVRHRGNSGRQMFQFIDFQRICISPHSEETIRHVLHIAVHGPPALGRIAEEISSQRRGYSPIERCIVGRCTGTMHRKSPVFGIAHQLFPPPCRREGRKTFRECSSVWSGTTDEREQAATCSRI